jgi:hypothetical protein
VIGTVLRIVPGESLLKLIRLLFVVSANILSPQLPRMRGAGVCAPENAGIRRPHTIRIERYRLNLFISFLLFFKTRISLLTPLAQQGRYEFQTVPDDWEDALVKEGLRTPYRSYYQTERLKRTVTGQTLS